MYKQNKLLQRDKHFKSKEKVHGQFFTPSEVSDFIVALALISINQKESACDPTCGNGVFLSSMIKYGFEEIIGVDIDRDIINTIPSSIKKSAKIMVGNALLKSLKLNENYFDLVAGNPPFSSKYKRVRDEIILSCYELGSDVKSQAIEVLFLERFIQLARNGGMIGTVLPDGIFLNTYYRKIREFILDNCRVLTIISLPRAIFKGSKPTTSKTSILCAIKGQKHEGKVFMAEIKNLNELDHIFGLYKLRSSGSNASWADVTPESLHPKTYLSEALKFSSSYPTIKLGELITDMHCGGTEYGNKRKFSNKGLKFISAKVVTPLGLDFMRDERKFIEENGPMDKKWAHVRVGDVLFVRVGVGCIGRTSVVIDEEDLGVADDWIYIITVKKEKISPCYLAVFIQSKHGIAQIEKFKRGVGTVTIPQRLLKEIVVPIPPIQFQERVELLYKEMVANRRKGFYDNAKKIWNEIMKDLASYYV